MEAFLVGIVVGGVLVYFYHKRKQAKTVQPLDIVLAPLNEHPRKEDLNDKQ